jgi:hypothetical protein
MTRVGSAEFQKLPMKRKVSLLVDRGYKQAAFAKKSNATQFARQWADKGYTGTHCIRSKGPVMEDGRVTPKAYYVIAAKARKPRAKGKIVR